MTTRYSIKDLEKLSGIKAHTIRAWESRYKLIEPKRTSTNIRYYGDDDLVILLNASILVESGVKISEVAAMAPQEMKDAALAASPYLGQYNYEMNELKLATTTFDVNRFEAVLKHCIECYGMHKTFQQIVGDFINELGKLWLNGVVSISQEHFISSLLRQKLFAALDQLEATKQEDAKTVVLFLPANELHELGILYLAYLLKEKSYKVYYLGQSLPMEYLVDLLQVRKIDYVISTFTTHPDSSELPAYLEEMSEVVQAPTEFHFTGFQTENVDTTQLPAHMHCHDTLKTLGAQF